jgi:hypothetical protein
MVNKRPTNAFKYPSTDIPSLSYMFRGAKGAILREPSWSCWNCCSTSWERNGIRVVYGELTYLLTYLITYLITYLLNYLLNYLLAYLLNYLLTYLLTHSLTHSLTPWSRILKNLTGPQLLKKFSAFCGTRRFMTAFKSACHLSLSRANSIQSIPPLPIPEESS